METRVCPRVLVLSTLLVFGCGSDPNSLDSTDASLDTDADTVSGSISDLDTGTSKDTATEKDIEMDSDTASDTDLDTDTNDVGIDSSTDLGFDVGTSYDSETSSDTDTDAENEDSGPEDAGSSYTGPIVLYSVTVPNGNLNGRTGADVLCADEQAKHLGLGGSTARALICVENNDEIRQFEMKFDVPSDQPVVALNETQLAANWSSFMNGLDVSLKAAGVFTSGQSSQFYMGCLDSDGGACTIGHNCSKFDTSSSSISACVGSADLTGNDWMATGNIRPCDTALSLLCISYAND